MNWDEMVGTILGGAQCWACDGPLFVRPTRTGVFVTVTCPLCGEFEYLAADIPRADMPALLSGRQMLIRGWPDKEEEHAI